MHLFVQGSRRICCCFFAVWCHGGNSNQGVGRVGKQAAACYGASLAVRGVKFASFPTPTEATGRRCLPRSIRAHILDATAVSSPNPCKPATPHARYRDRYDAGYRISDVASSRGSRAESRKYEIEGCRLASLECAYNCT